MPTDIDSIVEGFPYPTIPPINGQPTFTTLKELHVKLNANAASVHSNLGDGNLGYLYLTVTDEVYATLSEVPFIEPANPGMLPDIPAGASIRQANDVQRNFDENRRIFNEYTATDKALKQQLIGAIPDMYIKTLKHPISAYSTVTTKQILAHLYAQYGQLTPQDLQTNDEHMQRSYDPNTPIENLYEQIEQAVDIAATAGAPYSNMHILNVAYTIVFNTNAFPETCREWRRLPQADKTWNTFKETFTEAHRDYMQFQTQNNHRFHASNAYSAEQYNPNETAEQQQQTAEALANLASATAADRNAIANLTATNERLTQHIERLTKQLEEAMSKLDSGNQQQRNSSSNNRRPCQQTHYCWSHGFRVKPDGSHTSKTCTRRRRGHQEEATATNRMGGYEFGMNKNNE